MIAAVSLNEFLDLLREADEAHEAGDQVTFEACANRLELLGYTLVIHEDNSVHVQSKGMQGK